MDNKQVWQNAVESHKKGEITAAEMFEIGDAIDQEEQWQEWIKEQRAKRETTVIGGKYELMLDPGYQHVYTKWTPEQKAQVENFLLEIAPYFSGKTLIEMDGTNPGDLCRLPIKLFEGEPFFHIYPKSGEILSVLMILYRTKGAQPQ